MQPRFVFWNHQWLREEKALASINHRSFRYGDGCFETLKVLGGQILHWEAHWQRFSAGLTTLKMTLPSVETSDFWLEKCTALVAKNGDGRCSRLRMTAVRGGNGGLFDQVDAHPELLLQSWPLNPSNNRLNENGLVVGVYEAYRKSIDAFCNLKHNNYLGYAMAALHAKEQHWNDALVLNQHGHLADTCIANLWVWLDGRWTTPALDQGSVAGVRRASLLKQMSAAGQPVVESVVQLKDLPQVEAAFLSNSIYGIRWIKWLAGHELAADRVQALVHQVDAFK